MKNHNLDSSIVRAKNQVLINLAWLVSHASLPCSTFSHPLLTLIFCRRSVTFLKFSLLFLFLVFSKLGFYTILCQNIVTEIGTCKVTFSLTLRNALFKFGCWTWNMNRRWWEQAGENFTWTDLWCFLFCLFVCTDIYSYVLLFCCLCCKQSAVLQCEHSCHSFVLLACFQV